MSSIFVVKGKIKEVTISNNSNLALPGTLHFLPLTEIYINNNRKNYEDAVLENRINVVGEHRTGLIRYIKINLTKIENLEISEIVNPSIKTKEFIENVGILKLNPNSDEHLKFIKVIEIHKKCDTHCKFKTLHSSQEIQQLKEQSNLMIDSFKYKNLYKIENYLSDEVEFISKDRKHKNRISKQILLQNFDTHFDTEILNSLFKTNIDNIHPANNKLFIGQFGMKLFLKEHIYKITEIYLKNHKI
ncbi:MAG: hypothetical protein IPN73_16865 [Saprospiraceae bacterium]|nr:hypothetical protein [Saprospiraceae bacterium]MBK8851803.1 hypothetical protein [Saprospiraceae bacterium]